MDQKGYNEWECSESITFGIQCLCRSTFMTVARYKAVYIALLLGVCAFLSNNNHSLHCQEILFIIKNGMKSPHMHSNTTFFVLNVVAMFLYLNPATHTQWENEWYVMFGPPFSTLSHEWIRYRVFSFFVFLSFCVTSFFSVLVKVLLKRYVLLPFCYLPKIMYQKKYAHCSLPTMFFCVCVVLLASSTVLIQHGKENVAFFMKTLQPFSKQ